MEKKHKTRSQAMKGNQNARQGIDKKPSYKKLQDENELLKEMVDSMQEVLQEIKSLVN